MSYSNPGYAVAGHLIEKVTGEKFEDRIAERIFTPSGMPTSSFYLTKDDEAAAGERLSRSNRTGGAVFADLPASRPATCTPRRSSSGNFVHVLLNWGETAPTSSSIPNTSATWNIRGPRWPSDAGLRNGYGSGIASSSIEGFPMLGHGGGIDGFVSSYAYSTSRDVGFVVLLNSTHSPEAMRRISQLAVRYLKADIEAPAKPQAAVAESTLRAYEGYYHRANPRNQALAFLEWLLSGESMSVSGRSPVGEAGVRDGPGADPGVGLAVSLRGGSRSHARVHQGCRRCADPRRRHELRGAAVALADRNHPLGGVDLGRGGRDAAGSDADLDGHALAGSAGRDARRDGFWWLKGFLLLCAIAFVLPVHRRA